MQNKPRILLLNRSFWPDIEATGQFLTELSDGLADEYRITVIAGRSYYIKEKDFGHFSLYRREKFGAIEILRVRHARFWKKSLLGRFLNWITYCISVFISAGRLECDVIIVGTDPPFLPFVAMIMGRIKMVPVVYNCRDLYPDVAWGLEKLKKDDLLGRIYDWMNIRVMRSSTMVVCLGESMRSKIINKGIDVKRVRVICDWVDTGSIRPIPKQGDSIRNSFGIKEDRFVIMHSGNMGFSQNLGLVLEALRRVKYQDSFYMLFVGEGAVKEELQRKVRSLGIKNVLFFPYQAKEKLNYSLNLADLHIVSLKKGMSGAVVPSKIFGILAAGKAYLAISEEDCEAARLAREEGCGLWADAEDVENIARTIERAIDSPGKLKEMGAIGRRLALERFDKDIVIGEWKKILHEMLFSRKNEKDI